MAGLREALKQTKQGPTRPPGLRAASRTASCASCRYWKQTSMAAGKCRLYGGYPTEAGQVSDAFNRR